MLCNGYNLNYEEPVRQIMSGTKVKEQSFSPITRLKVAATAQKKSS